MSELIAIVITVEVAEPVEMPGHLGRANHALLLRWLKEIDPKLAQKWHDDQGHKPFTCSTLIGARRTGMNQRVLQPNTPYWFRITSIDDEITQVLKQIVAHPPEQVELEYIRFHVKSVISEGHKWAGRITYEELAAPYLVFGSLADRWNAFSPVGISPEMRAFAASGIAMTRFQLRSRVIPFKNTMTGGAVGHTSYITV